MSAISRWVRRVSSGRRAPNEKNTCAPAPGPARRPRGTGTAPPPPPCTADRCTPRRTRHAAPRAAVLAGRALTISAGIPRSASWPPRYRTRSGSHSTTASRRGAAPGPRWAANTASATDTRSSSPSTITRCPASAPASCIRSTRCSFVPGVQWVWSRSSFAAGTPSAARSSSPVSAAAESGTTVPRPSQTGHWPVTWGGPAPGVSCPVRLGRPAGVSCTGRARSTTPRLRSSLQTATTIGTGSSARRLTSRAATGSCRAMTRSTSATPAGPSASPTAAATSATTASTSISGVLVGSSAVKGYAIKGRASSILPHHAR